MNCLPMDSCVRMASVTSGTDGGITMPGVPPAASAPVARLPA